MGAEVAVLAVGTGIQAYSQYQQGRQQAEAAKQQAKFKRAQAREMLERMAIEEKNLNEQGAEFKAKQTSAYAAGGVAIGTGATLLALEDTNAKIYQKIYEMKRDTQFRSAQLMKGADVSMQEAEQMKTAGKMGAVGTLLSGSYTAYRNS